MNFEESARSFVVQGKIACDLSNIEWNDVFQVSIDPSLSAVQFECDNAYYSFNLLENGLAYYPLVTADKNELDLFDRMFLEEDEEFLLSTTSGDLQYFVYCLNQNLGYVPTIPSSCSIHQTT